VERLFGTRALLRLLDRAAELAADAKITAARIYFDVGTLLKQIIDQRDH